MLLNSHYHSYRPVTRSHHAPKSHYSRKSYQPVHKPQPKCHYQTVQKCSTIHEQVCKKIYVTVPYTYEEKVPEKVCQKPKVVVKTKIEKVPAKEAKVECTKVPIKVRKLRTIFSKILARLERFFIEKTAFNKAQDTLQT